jgi:DNA-binding transcriptional MerR regulator/effector-binding domain-containing protein
VLLRTGAFARASTLSVKALRVYHEMGLLVPAVVDPETGYRAYSPAQLTDAAIIRLLREVGVSLQDIGTVLAARDLGYVRKVLAEQAERFQAGLDAVGRLVDDLSLEAEEADPGGVVVRREEARLVLAVDGSPRMADLGAFVHRCQTVLWDAASASGAVVGGCFGGCYPTPIEEDRQDVTAFLPIAAPVLVAPEFGSAGVRVDELPACEVAVLELRGSYLGLEACYRRLGAWVAFHAVPADPPVRELYLTPIGGPEEEPVTELLWPVLVDHEQ